MFWNGCGFKISWVFNFGGDLVHECVLWYIYLKYFNTLLHNFITSIKQLLQMKKWKKKEKNCPFLYWQLNWNGIKCVGIMRNFPFWCGSGSVARGAGEGVTLYATKGSLNEWIYSVESLVRQG